jgi:hypothetical protein
MWGSGSRDLHTIPSEFARLAEQDGMAVQVTNYGERAWVSWQEVIFLMEELARGERPDVVVFYDGWNDTYVRLTVDPSAEPTHEAIDGIRRGFDADVGLFLERFSAYHIVTKELRNRAGMAVLPHVDVNQTARNVAASYNATRGPIAALAQ